MISQRISHYNIIKKLGAGGMGEVYLAEDTQLDRRVAIKILRPDTEEHESAKQRLIREAKAAAAVDHPNICAIHEVSEENGCTFIVMQYLEGETLADRLKRPLGLQELLPFAIQIADGLAEAHSHNIIHRDIKPQNIMLTARGHVKMLDFGLARVVQAEPSTDSGEVTQSLLTEPGVILGTVSYMSPEQVRGETLDARSDLFSFGVVLYEMISGRHPFGAQGAAATLSAILTVEPPPLARFASAIPDEMQRIVRKCLEKDKEDRCQSASDLLIDLKNLKRETESRFVRSEPVAKRPLSNLSKIVYAACAVLVLVIASVGIYLITAKGNPIDSVAILPFVNASADTNMDYLSDGIPDSISISLSQLPNLKVMSRNSVFSFKGREINAQEVGQTLGVRAVLTGKVTKRGDGLAITIELVDVRDNSQIWGQQYNRKLADVFALQEEIAKETSEKLRLKLSGPEKQQLAKRPTENIRAFQHYMQGRSFAQRRTREDLQKAVRYYETAIEEDRNYALAWAGLADANTILGARGQIAPQEGRRKAEEAALKALELDENLAEAHATFGQAQVSFAPYNFNLGDGELRRAMELSPSLAMAYQYLGVSLARQGRMDEGLEQALKARELDPLSSIIARLVALHYYLKRDHVQALQLLRQANKLGPPLSVQWEVEVYIQNRLLDETLAELEKAKRERPDDPTLIYSTGVIYAAQGKRSAALSIIKELEEMSGANLSQAHWIAKVYATLNDQKQALTWLERGVAAGAIGLFYKDEPVWDILRGDPRFVDLLSRMGVPQ